MSLTEDVRAFALEQGADLVGFASIDRFEGAPDKYDPKRLLPDVKTVISMAIRILDGVTVPQVNGVEHYPYQLMGYGWLSNARLNMVGFEVARMLEDRGHVTLPFPSFFEGKQQSVSNRHAAVAAGIAEFGWHNLAMSPRFGTRQRFVTLLTEAELDADPMLDEGLCDECMVCVEACPVGALSGDEATTFEIAGRTIRMGKVDKGKCCACHAGKGGGFEHSYPTTVTFTAGGHCGRCLLACPRRGDNSGTQG